MSDCGVCISHDVDGYVDMWEQSICKTRKAHKCCECKRDIPKGSRCERTSGKWEGKFSTDHTCLDCMNIRQAFECGGVVCIGTLWEDLGNVFSDVNTGCIQRIETASAKAYFVQRWQRWKGLTA